MEWVNNLGFDDWIKIKYGKVDAVTKEKIWIGCMSRSSLCECKAYEHEYNETIQGDEQNQQRKENREERPQKDGTSFDDDDIDGIMDYLKLQGTEGFTDPDDETYEQRWCKLLGLQYKKPPPIIAETYEVTRYHLGPEERFSKVRRIETKEYCRTATNVAWIRHILIKEMDESEQVLHDPT